MQKPHTLSSYLYTYTYTYICLSYNIFPYISTYSPLTTKIAKLINIEIIIIFEKYIEVIIF